MRMKKRILVFPCGSEIGLEIHNALQFSMHVELFGGSSSDDHCKFVYKNYIGCLPFIYDTDFIAHLNKVLIKYKIAYIYPAHDDVLYYLAKNLRKLKCGFIGPTSDTAEICRFKSKTYQYFRKLLPTPNIYNDISTIEKYPVFLKPDAGQGSRGTFIANSEKEASLFLERDKSLLILEYLPKEEYTVDCFTNRYGKLLFVGPRTRSRIQSGISVNTYPVKNKQPFINYAEIINNNLRLRYAWFFQVKRSSKGELILMEIAPRIAGSMALYRNLGINFELLSIFDACDIDVTIEPNDFNIILDRSLSNKFKVNVEYDCVYVDLDDCLLLKNKINTTLISFLYQCVNYNKAVYLITKHKKNINNTLKRYKIGQLFDKIYHLNSIQQKSSVIKQEKAIFIDDSFSERLKVKSLRRIPVFSPDAVECLLK